MILSVTPRPVRIVVVGPSRYGLGQPFAGGLEAHTAGLVAALHRRDHDVTVIAGPLDASHALPVDVLPIVGDDVGVLFNGRRRDIANPAGFALDEAASYSRLLTDLIEAGRADVVHNNSLHPAVVDADDGRVPFVHVLHSPPFSGLEDAHRRLQARGGGRRVVAVSQSLADEWEGLATDVVPNGVDTTLWQPGGAERRGAVWAGRLVPEKAAHLAIRAARLAGLTLDVVGPVVDTAYFDRFVKPMLDDRTRWLGALDTEELSRRLASAEVGIVSPTWAEPFCLVAAEMISCGTPVAAFRRGGLPEFLPAHVAVLAAPGDAVSLADAALRARRLDPERCREHAIHHLSIDTMVDRYEEYYRAGTAVGVPA